MSKQKQGSNEKTLYNGCYITQSSSVYTLEPEVVEDLGQLDVSFGIARQQQQAYCRYVRVGVSEEQAFWLEKLSPAGTTAFSLPSSVVLAERRWWDECQRSSAGWLGIRH